MAEQLFSYAKVLTENGVYAEEILPYCDWYVFREITIEAQSLAILSTRQFNILVLEVCGYHSSFRLPYIFFKKIT